MNKLIMTKGLPASGKSTWAKAEAEKVGNKRVNKDDLRAMLDAGRWSKGNEEFILEVRDELIVKTLRAGQNIIVDDTNLDPKHEARLRELAKQENAEFEIKDFTDVSLEECLKRDLNRANSVGKQVIMRMYNQYLKPEVREVEKVEYDPSLRDCYIFDIDGTLAIKGDRSPYDWKRVGEDTVNSSVARTLKMLRVGAMFSYSGQVLDRTLKTANIIIFSGRDAVCQPETLEWLHKNNIEFDDLVMRPEGDQRKDSIVKREMYEATIKGKFNVIAVFDDRNQVVEMWRELGLACFQVAEGDF